MDSEYLIISASLRPDSRSRVLANHLVEHFRSLAVTHRLIDLRDYPLPLCDGEDSYDDPSVAKLQPILASARVIIAATPIYNYDANAALKNLIELTGDAWENKIVGFICAAGGSSSYMSIMSIANSLMLDFRCLILPRFVYALSRDFDHGELVSSEIKSRINELAEMSVRVHYNR
ncbi:MAG: NAD(P)H-dependent oxidoreductase [Verrucomicrobia bacterium]|nr:NAD(P)H-dependent oxidoreductase [Verrucomicrobiota bacterium]